MTMTPRPRVDYDTLYVLTEGVAFLADLRDCCDDPDTHRLDPADTLHLLASLILQAQAWLPLAAQAALDHGYTREQIALMLGLPDPDPLGWHNR